MMESNTAGLHYHAALLVEGSQDVCAAQHSTGAYNIPLPDEQTGKARQRDSFDAVGSGQSDPACVDTPHTSTRPDLAVEQPGEDFVYLDTPDSSLYIQDDHATLSAALDTGERLSAHSGPPDPPSKPASVSELKEEFPNPHTEDTVPEMHCPGNYPSGMDFDSQCYGKAANRTSQHDFLIAANIRQAYSGSPDPPSKPSSVAEQPGEELPNPHTENAVANVSYSPGNRLQNPFGTCFDGRFDGGDANRTSQTGFSIILDTGRNVVAHSHPQRSPGQLISVTEQPQGVVGAHSPNIVIFGETGVGKSSVINLIANQKLARTSNDAVGCTFQHERYPITLGKMSCAIWDTTGLDEGSEGTVPARLAEANLEELMHKLVRSGGIRLVIYCIRGTRLTKALKRNYDLFYVTVCRKKVPVALVVTGLEYQEGEMETWWATNEATLRRNGMRFDAHACVTTVDVEDQVVKQRRSDSRELLCELVVKYSELPAWKAHPSFLSQILPTFYGVLRGALSMGVPGSTTTIRRVAICGSFSEFFPGTTPVVDKSISRTGDRQYEYIRVDKRALRTHTPRISDEFRGTGAGVLVFYTSALVENHVQQTDVDALKTFYDVAGGHMCPVIVVLRGCDDDEVAQACRAKVSRHSDIHADFVPFHSTGDAQEKLREMIERLCVERIETKSTRFLKRYVPASDSLFPSWIRRLAHMDDEQRSAPRLGDAYFSSPRDYLY